MSKPRRRQGRPSRRRGRKQPYTDKIDFQKAGEHATEDRRDARVPAGYLIDQTFPDEVQEEEVHFGIGFTTDQLGNKKFTIGGWYRSGSNGLSPLAIAFNGVLLSAVPFFAGIFCILQKMPIAAAIVSFSFAAAIFLVSAGIAVREQAHRLERNRDLAAAIREASTSKQDELDVPNALEVTDAPAERPAALEGGEA